MGRRRRHLPPFETEITHLGPKGVGVGRTPRGDEVYVRGAVPGSRVFVRPFKRKKRRWLARPVHTVRPPADGVQPRCAVFGLCGGCTLQALPLARQRSLKHALAVDDVLGDDPLPRRPRIHPMRGAPDAYGYRNKVELSFGPTRFVPREALDAGAALDGAFLGFHASGRFDRVVDTTRCELIDDDANRLLATVRRTALSDGAPPPWAPRTHEGFWRHLLIRHGQHTGELLVVLFTASPPADDDGAAEAAVHRVAEALQATELEDSELVGMQWRINDGVADVARGTVRHTWGRDHLFESLGDVTYRLSPDSFFQTSSDGAEVLYDTIGEALGDAPGTLVDLYCGTGGIGLYLAGRGATVIGLEEVEAAVQDARANAAANGIDATYRCTRVEDALDTLHTLEAPRRLVVDPPRAGLHPKAARALADADAEVLIYVACNPRSLGRDRPMLEAGGWELTDLYTVDLFPQTGHTEAVARFVKPEPRGTVLLTGFGPFGAVRHNPSAKLVRALHGMVVAGHRIVGEVLPVSYGPGLDQAVARAKELDADLVIGFGVDPAAALARVETRAVATTHPDRPDADGVLAPSRPGEGPRHATLDASRLAELLDLPTSDDAGTYVCNAWLYRVPAEIGAPAGFVHIPPSGLDAARVRRALTALLAPQGDEASR